MKNILFVCKYNRFRSQVAEQFFKKYNPKKSISVSSAGIFQGEFPLDKTQVKAAKEFGIDIMKRPEPIKISNLMNVDLIVIVAKDVPKEIFKYNGKYLQKIVVWKISDVFFGSIVKNKKVISLIEKRVKIMIDKL